MIDVSFGVPRLPLPSDPLDTAGANAIEANLAALIRAWPAFETAALLDSLGSYGYLDTRDGERASPAEGLIIELLQYLPRLLVLLEGEGLENLAWTGPGWTEEAPGVLVYPLGELTQANAMAALRTLTIGAHGDADLTVTLAGENPDWEPDGLRLYGAGQVKLLFRGRCTWGLARAKKHTWGGAAPLSWGGAAALRKD